MQFLKSKPKWTMSERAWPHCESKNYKISWRHVHHPKWVEYYCVQGNTSVDVIPLVGNWQHWAKSVMRWILPPGPPGKSTSMCIRWSTSSQPCLQGRITALQCAIPNILGPHSLPIKYKRFSGGRVYLSPRCLLDSPKEFFTKSKTWSSSTHWIWLCWPGEVWSRNLGYPVCSPAELLKIMTPRLQSKNLGFGLHILYKQTMASCVIGEKTASNLDVRW